MAVLLQGCCPVHIKLLGMVGRSARVFFLFLMLAKKAAILSCL